MRSVDPDIPLDLIIEINESTSEVICKIKGKF